MSCRKRFQHTLADEPACAILPPFVSFDLTCVHFTMRHRWRSTLGDSLLSFGLWRWLPECCWEKKCVNMLSGLDATRHPVAKAARPAPASQSGSARKLSVRNIKPLKSVRGSPTHLSHCRDHRDNTRRIARLGKKPFSPVWAIPCMSAITRSTQSRTRSAGDGEEKRSVSATEKRSIRRRDWRRQKRCFSSPFQQ